MSFSLNDNSPGSKTDFSEKCLFGIWRFIFSRYNTKWYIHDKILKIQYIKGPMKNEY